MSEPTPVVLALPASAGGIGQHVRTVSTELLRRGHHVTVLAPSSTGELFGFREGGAEFVAADVGTGSPRELARARQLVRRSSQPTAVIHAHGVRAAVAMAGLDRPLVATWHNAPLGGIGRRAAHSVLERLAARVVAVTLVASEDLADRARAAGAGAVHFAPVVAPPLAASGVDRDEVRRRLRAPLTFARDDGPIVLVVARLHPQKRVDVLIRAAADNQLGKDTLVLVAGDGPLLARLQSQAAAVGAKVRFLGRRSDVADLLVAADVVVLTSDWEARPLVAQEALRSGVPLVSTAVGGVPGLVGDAAMLVPPDDPAAVRGAINAVLADPSLRERLVRAGVARSATWPTVATMVDDLEAIYAQVRATPNR